VDFNIRTKSIVYCNQITKGSLQKRSLDAKMSIWTKISSSLKNVNNQHGLNKFVCPDFGVLCPTGGDAAIRTLEFVSNNFVEKISKKAQKNAF
jgi:hypothetical protein